MKRSRFNEEQIIAIFKQQEAGMTTADVCRRYRISSATSYKWESKSSGQDASEARRLRSLEEENSRLKKLLAEAMLDNAVWTRRAAQPTIWPQKMAMPGARREAVAHARAHHGVSELKERMGACALVGVRRRVIRYMPTRPDNGALRQRLRKLMAERRRFGYLHKLDKRQFERDALGLPAQFGSDVLRQSCRKHCRALQRYGRSAPFKGRLVCSVDGIIPDGQGLGYCPEVMEILHPTMGQTQCHNGLKLIGDHGLRGIAADSEAFHVE